MAQAQLLLCCQASWYPLAAISQSQLLMFGEDGGDPPRLLWMMSADTSGFQAPGLHEHQQQGGSPVPHVQVLHHPLVINQACCRGNRGSRADLWGFVPGSAVTPLSQHEAVCRGKSGKIIP